MLKTIFTILSFVLLFSTTVCGLWLKSQPKVEPSSIQFHMTIGLITVAVVAITLLLKR